MNVRPVFETPFERKGIISPGLPVLPHGVERYVVRGGGSQAVKIEKGDEISIVDREGLQPVEMIFFAPDGTSDATMIGAKGGHNPVGIQSALSSGEQSAQRIMNALKVSGFDIGRADGIKLFAESSKAGETAGFFASTDGLLIVCAVGNPMLVWEQNPATEIVIFLRRANPAQGKGGRAPADPLADPLQDHNIQPGNAKSYEVRKGEFIQIMDVQGRECTDFQCFSMAELDSGIERDIDMTTTRSLTGCIYPAPGTMSKFWSVDQEPLFEIVQDTCGRHDAFGLSCYPRYYDDAGYPGHVNCSDNINAELEQWNIRPRVGWPSINFFFNTMIDDHHVISIDDPWSRPGDFVLLRALTDIVAVSTACPCDIDPTNAWNPTDIQVRVYKDTEDFKPSSGFRKSPEADLEQTKKTGFHKCFARHSREFVEYNGYWLANQMSNHGAIAEYWAAREKAVVMDLSPLRKYEVTGPDAETLMQHCVTRNMKKLSVGGIVYTAMCYDHGGMIDDGTVFRLGDNNFRWIGGNDSSGKWLRDIAAELELNAWVKSSTDQLHNIAVQGPLSRDILAEVFWTPPTHAAVEDLAWFRFTTARIGDIQGTPIVLSRTGYSGELGYEVFCHPKDAEEVFDAIWKAGEPKGMIPLGLAALDMLRIEAGLIFAGYEFSDETDPFEAGIGFTVPLKTQEDNFTGRAAIEKRKEHPHRKLVGLDIEGGLVPAHGDCVRIGKAQIGVVTSAMKSPYLGKVIALARLDVTHSATGTTVEIGQLDGEQKRLKATVTTFPHFDPNKERVRGNY
ncbi:MAG: DUF1989 domain-containing protein [Paracoccaceae bacterium]|jgi:aminomethyltransferase